jgi:adenylate cyclase
VNTAREVVEQINDDYENTWMGPLRLIRSAIEDERLGVDEKLSLLTSGVKDITDIAALQVTVEGAVNPLLATKNRIAERLGIDPADLAQTLRIPPEQTEAWLDREQAFADGLVHLPGDLGGADHWLLTIAMPIRGGLAGRRAVLSARVSLDRLQTLLARHPFNRVGDITVIDATGKRLLGARDATISDFEIVRAATGMLRSPSQTITVAPYPRPSGEVMLGAFTFPRVLPWAVLVEQDERHAYQAVDKMKQSLALWGLIGVGIAIAGAILLSLRLSRPIQEMARVVHQVSLGNLGVRVQGVRSQDEIGRLATQINEMIQGLRERFNLERFVSRETLSAVKDSDESGVKLGGERRLVTVLFSDIRGFTAFSESVEPEVVIDMLNTFLRHQAYIVKQYQGDIDKFVGDELVAVFQGKDMVRNAAHCAQAIQEKVNELNNTFPEWPIRIGIGINTGEVIMGAMGSEERMDYTILGDPVNLGARLCSHAKGAETLVSANSYRYIADTPGIIARPLDAINVKGKAQPIPVYRLVAVLDPASGNDAPSPNAANSDDPDPVHP